MSKVSIALLALMVVGSNAVNTEAPSQIPAPKTAADGTVIYPNPLTASTNAQAEDCSSAQFRKASDLNTEANHADLFHPNVEWEPVPTDKWSFAENDDSVSYPLGYRRGALNHSQGSVMCLKMSAKTAQHKLEVSVESTGKGTLCLTDTRKGQLNGASTSLVRTCDDDGQVTACFSAIDGSAATSQDGLASFAVAIGCVGSGCHHESDNVLFYRVRQSTMTWNDRQSADKNLDMWYETMAAHSTDLEWAKKMADPTAVLPTAAESPANMVPQMYPTDLWASVKRAATETDPNHANATDRNGDSFHPKNGASTVAVSMAAMLLPVLALLF